jgi:hypothetical protein
MENSTNNFELLLSKTNYYLQQGLFWGLSLQALWATYQSIKIIFSQIPEAEQKLLTDTITSSDVNFLINDAILAVFSGVIGITMAAWFARSLSQQAKIVQNILGVIAVIANFWLLNLLGSQNSTALIKPLTQWAVGLLN